MNKTPTPFIVVTDLDGTLLDHYTYSWEAAAATLEVLKQRQIPVIINTSKTFDEVVALQQSLGVTAPFIVENGSAVFLPKDHYPSVQQGLQAHQGFYCKLLGQQRQQIVTFLHDLRKGKAWQFSGYSDWDLAKISELTGLDAAGAEMSQSRAFSEPLIWQDSSDNLQQFKNVLQQENLTLLKGGRFYHVLGSTNKGLATKWVQSLYTENTPVVCLGDSPNDVEMLDVADVPVWVKSDKQPYPELTRPNAKMLCTDGVGPVGWAEALNHILQQIK